MKVFHVNNVRSLVLAAAMTVVVLLIPGLLLAVCPVQDNIVLVGHSAGAHLSALAILFLIDCRDELFVEAGVQRHIAKAIKGLIGESRGTC